ncbi:MAG: esterase/lipase family protein [Polyangiales bacterium]
MPTITRSMPTTPRGWLLTLATLLAAEAIVFTIGVYTYLAVSFALMAKHRAIGAREIARALAREAFWVFLTQPLLPYFYVLGRRMGGRDGGVPVVMVHGYMQNRVDFLRIARALRNAGSGPLFGFNYLWARSVPGSARRLATFVEEVCRETGAARVDLIGHSLGGVVSIEYLAHGGAERVRRCVTIASPHAGVLWRGPVIGKSGRDLRHDSDFFRTRKRTRFEIPCLSIASTHDNVVHPPATSSIAPRGGVDLLVDHYGHLSTLFAPAVVDAVVEFCLAREGAEAPVIGLVVDNVATISSPPSASAVT